MKNPSHNAVAAVAQAWAEIDGKAEDFRIGQECGWDEGGYYKGYMSEAAQIIKRIHDLGFAIVPVEPSEGLLASMAMRQDHGFGVYDASLQRAMLTTMRQVYEEVSGKGFYDASREDEYTAQVKDTDSQSIQES